MAQNYTLTRKFWKFFGAEMTTVDEAGDVVAFTEAKRFKLKEDITIYGDSSKSNELARVKARSIIDLGATYDIYEPESGVKIGALRRKALSSIFVKDKWLLLNEQDQEVGAVEEESSILGVLRRLMDFIALLVPQEYNVIVGDRRIGTFKRTFNLFIVKYYIAFEADAFEVMDKRQLFAAVNMLAFIDASKG